MSEKEEKHHQTSFCDAHLNKVAVALCQYHKKLLCVTCLLEEAKSSECPIIEIQDISGDQDTILYEGLIVRQIAINKRRLLEEHEHKTYKLKNHLDNEVNDFHQKLITSLDKMKTDCQYLIKKAADEVVAQHKNSTQQLEIVEREIAENLENLSADSNVELSMIQQKLQEVKTKLEEKIPDHYAEPEGKFKADEKLNDLISKSGSTLGEVILISQYYYEPVCGPNLQRNGDEVTDTEINDESVNQHSVHLSSDEVIYSRTTENYTRKQTTETGAAVNNSSKKHQDGGNKKQDINANVKEEMKTKRTPTDVKKRKGFLGLFHRNTPDSEKREQDTRTETDNDDITDKRGPEKQTALKNSTENKRESIDHPRHLIDKTAPIVGMGKAFSSACKFSKLVYLGADYLGLFSKAHDTVVLTSIDGKFHARIKIPGLSDIVACGREQIATIKIVDKNLQVTKYKVSDKKFETYGSFTVNVDVPKVTGLDFDKASSKFAVSSPDKLVVFKTGKTEREISYCTRSNSVTNEEATAYDFSNDCVYVMDLLNKTLKCFSFARSDYLWKIQFDSQLPARKLCLYEDKLFITVGEAVVVLNAKDGKPVQKHDTFDLLDDCDGICVINGVIVFSSNSSDFDTSAKLAYISI